MADNQSNNSSTNTDLPKIPPTVPTPDPVTPPKKEPTASEVAATNALVESLIHSNTPGQTSSPASPSPAFAGTIIPPATNEKPKPKKKSGPPIVATVATILILLIALPVGVYFLSQRNKQVADIRTQARGGGACYPGGENGDSGAHYSCNDGTWIPDHPTCWSCVTVNGNTHYAKGSWQGENRTPVCCDSPELKCDAPGVINFDGECLYLVSGQTTHDDATYFYNNCPGNENPCTAPTSPPNPSSTPLNTPVPSNTPVPTNTPVPSHTPTGVISSPTTTPTGQPTHTPTPSLTPTPSPTPLACQSIHIYKKDKNGNFTIDITDTLRAGTSGVKVGDTIEIGVVPPASANAARIRVQVDGGEYSDWTPDPFITAKNAKGEFITDYLLASSGSVPPSRFVIEAETRTNSTWR
jgi:hypothetical protein